VAVNEMADEFAERASCVDFTGPEPVARIFMMVDHNQSFGNPPENVAKLRCY